MSSGKYVVKRPMNKTIIKDGKIVRLRKDGTISSVVGPYPPEKKNG